VTAAQRSEVIAVLRERIDVLGDIELEMVDAIVARVYGGQLAYGEFQDDDPRDFAQEGHEENLDWLIYMARDHVRRRRGG